MTYPKEQVVRCLPNTKNKLFCGNCRGWVDIKQADAHVKECWNSNASRPALRGGEVVTITASEYKREK